MPPQLQLNLLHVFHEHIHTFLCAINNAICIAYVGAHNFPISLHVDTSAQYNVDMNHIRIVATAVAIV